MLNKIMVTALALIASANVSATVAEPTYLESNGMTFTTDNSVVPYSNKQPSNGLFKGAAVTNSALNISGEITGFIIVTLREDADGVTDSESQEIQSVSKTVWLFEYPDHIDLQAKRKWLMSLDAVLDAEIEVRTNMNTVQ